MAARKPVVRKLTAYNPARAQLKEFEDNYNSIVIDCSTPKGMKSAKDCRKEIRDARSNLEDLRKETKAPFLVKGTQVDDEAKAIKVKLDTLFEKFDGSIKAIENAKEIAQQKERDAALAKGKELDEREAAIIAKEIELGLREPEEDDDKPSDDSADDISSDGMDDPAPVVEPEGGSTVICQPHIDLSNKRLDALRSIRDLIEPTDPQPESGEIDDKIAVQHDQVLAEVWEVVDELT